MICIQLVVHVSDLNWIAFDAVEYCSIAFVFLGHPLELTNEAEGEKQTHRVLQKHVSDVSGVRWKPAPW